MLPGQIKGMIGEWVQPNVESINLALEQEQQQVLLRP